MKSEAGSLKEFKKIDKRLANLIKKKKERTQKIKSRMREERSQPTLQKHKQRIL